MSAFPKVFKVESRGESGVQSTWINQLKDKPSTPITMAIPPEFEGPGGTYSPEDLYALSLLNCYLATFKFVAEKSKLSYKQIAGEATLYVDKGEEKAPWMERILLSITLSGCTDKTRSLNMLEKTKAHCMILNSVKTKTDFEFSVHD